MADHNHRPAEMGFIFTDLMLNFNDILMRSATEKVNLDLFVQGALAEASAWTDKDTGKDSFESEWRIVQTERSQHHTKKDNEGYYPGAEGFESDDLAFRVREMMCIIRSAYRMGIISKIATNSTKWDPIGQAVPAA